MCRNVNIRIACTNKQYNSEIKYSINKSFYQTIRQFLGSRALCKASGNKKVFITVLTKVLSASIQEMKVICRKLLGIGNKK